MSFTNEQGKINKIAVLIPCFNEAGTIAKVVREYRSALPEAVIMVCDNHSSDGTGEIAQAAGVDVDAPCSGNGTCGKCLVRIMAGVVDSKPHYKLAEEAYADNWRLLCQSKVLGDCTVWVPLGAGSFKKGIQTADLSTPEELARYETAIERAGRRLAPFGEKVRPLNLAGIAVVLTGILLVNSDAQ